MTDGRHALAILCPVADEEGSPRSRRLTFEFRNFNLYPDGRDGDQLAAVPEKVRRHVSRCIGFMRAD